MNAMYDKVEFFKSYFSRATEKKILIQSLDVRLTQLNANARILDLGCNDGMLIKTIVQQYQNRITDKLTVVGVDPSEAAIEKFLVHNVTSNYSVNAFIGTAEDYFEKHHYLFDWIFASQCLYWSPDLQYIINEIHSNSDSALIVLRDKKGIFEIQSYFKDVLGNKAEQMYSADDIEMALKAQNIPFNKEYHQTYIELPHQDEQEYDWLIAFFLQLDEELSPALGSKVKEFIAKNAKANRLQHDVVFFWLGKAMN